MSYACHFDFEQVSKGRVKGLWCVLPRHENYRRRLLLFSRTLFISRLNAEGRLLAGSVDEVNAKIAAREQKYKAKIEPTRVPFLGAVDKQKMSAQLENAAEFGSLVDEYMRQGFSRLDAERRAELNLCRKVK